MGHVPTISRENGNCPLIFFYISCVDMSHGGHCGQEKIGRVRFAQIGDLVKVLRGS